MLLTAEDIKCLIGIVLLVQSLAARERTFPPHQRSHLARVRNQARCCRAWVEAAGNLLHRWP